MDSILSLLARHGYVVISAVVFAEAVGLPVPAALAMVGAGAAAAGGALRPWTVLAIAICTMLIGDSLLFVLGKYSGWGLLGFLCRVSANPETCILRSAELFYKRGKTTLLFAKFVPGINTMAPPLAGSMKMPFFQFFRFDALGAVLYISAFFTIGYVFRDFLAAITRGFRTAGHVVEIVLLAAIAAYVVYRVWVYRDHAVYRVIPRVHVGELAAMIASEDRNNIIVADVRSHGYYDPEAARIPGSIRLEPNNLSEEIQQLPRDKDIYLYCT